uniref:Uncharacterized protein n=1 Tax=Ochrobactrum phage ORM_20 TaxID=2985243 RepID=A0A9N6ZEY4_9VIRU|nr:hypothetical protein ORM20_00013 [Ochrobactrum phage ORM_20]
MFDPDRYLDEKFPSRAYADKAFADFVTLLRRFRKYERGTSEAHVIYNMVAAIENTFDREFVDYVLRSRFNRDDRMKYNACRVIREGIHVEHDVTFRKRVEIEILKNRKGY